MNKSQRSVLLCVLLIAVLAIPTVAVLAKELGLLTISGPGIKGEVSIDHEGGMRKLEQNGFFDPSKIVKAPENLGAGYNITASLNLDGKMVPFVEMVYYAAEKGEPGFVHFTARLNGESLKPVDQWAQLNPDADTAFRGLMNEYNITLQPAIVSAPAEVAPAAPAAAEPVVVPAASPAPVQTPYVVASIAAILVLVGAGLALRRRSISQRSA